MLKKNKIQPSYVILMVSVAIMFISGFFTYQNFQNLFIKSLQERILAIVNTSTLLFDYRELDKIQNKSSVNSPEYVSVIRKMLKIRMLNPAIQFVDIYRKTARKNLFEYVADADSLHPSIPVDLNKDGVINEEDALSYPGDIYDGSDVPNFVKNAFIKPDVDNEIESHQWGKTLDASSPIHRRDGKLTNYVLNVSLNVSEFIKQERIAVIPFIIFIIILVTIVIVQTTILLKMWSAKVKLLQNLDQQKDELLSIVSHQLAAPVTSIKWYIEMMLDGDTGEVPEEQKKMLASMQNITGDLADLVGMILDVSRIQLGRMKLDPQPLDLNTFFEEILQVIDPKAAEKPVHFVKNVPAGLPTVLLDKRYTRMTVENLLTNAIKYTPQNGDVTLKVELRGERLYCEVRDTGCGIPVADQGKIFGKQFRASNVRNTIDGNGFGLYVAKGAVESQDGKIWFESTEGKGTAFFIDLPLKKPEPASTQAKPEMEGMLVPKTA